MITTFHTTGAIAGIVNSSKACRIPTRSPVSPSSSTTGNSTCASPTVSALSAAEKELPVNRGMITPAKAISSAVIPPSPIRMIQNRLEASRKASRFRPSWSSSVNTGTKAADSAACAKSPATKLGIW